LALALRARGGFLAGGPFAARSASSARLFEGQLFRLEVARHVALTRHA